MMKQCFENLANRLGGMADWLLIVTTFFMVLVNNYLWPIISVRLIGPSIFSGSEEFISGADSWWFITIVVPIGETLFFQFLLLHHFLSVLPHWISLLFSAVIFGLTHFYNPLYFIMATFGGIFLGLAFYIWWIKKGSWPKALIFVSLIHGLVNAAAIFVNSSE